MAKAGGQTTESTNVGSACEQAENEWDYVQRGSAMYGEEASELEDESSHRERSEGGGLREVAGRA